MALKRSDFYPGPRLPAADHLLPDDEPLPMKFVRWFVENADRMRWGTETQRVFAALALIMNTDNVAHTTTELLHKNLKIPKRSVYNHLEALYKSGAVVLLQEEYWMLDPMLVYNGAAKYHRRVRSKYRMLCDQQPKDKSPTNHERNDDEQCDLQARSGDPDPAHDAARAECA